MVPDGVRAARSVRAPREVARRAREDKQKRSTAKRETPVRLLSTKDVAFFALFRLFRFS